MKRFLIVLLLAIFANTSFAQQTLQSPAAVQASIKKAIAATENPKKAVKSKTWIKLAQAYLDAIELRTQSEAVQKMSKVHKSSLVSLKKAAKSLDKTLKKATEVDNNDPKKPGKNAKRITSFYYKENNQPSLKLALIMCGGQAYEAKEYKVAMNCFGRAADISAMPSVNATDTAAYFNAGIAANLAKEFDKAVGFYQKAVNLKYQGAKTIALMTKAMAKTKDSVNIATVLQSGIENFPAQNQPLIDELIDFYLKRNKIQEALDYIDVAIKKDPSKHIYYYVKGTLFDKQGKIEEARVQYEKTAEVNPEFYAAWFNIGVLYYNKGRDLILKANDVPPTGAANQKKYDALLKEGSDQFEKSLVPFEKAYAISPDDEATLQALKEVYYKLKKMDKYKEVKAKIDAIEAKNEVK